MNYPEFQISKLHNITQSARYPTKIAKGVLSYALLLNITWVYASSPNTSYLPKASQEITVFVLGQSKEMDKVTQKMQKGFQKNKEYFLKILQGLKQGGPLPYDEKLGVSREEYENYQRNARGSFHLIPTGKAKLVVEKSKPNITLRVTSGIDNFVLNYDVNTDVFTSPELGGSKPSSFFEDTKSPLGAIKGYSWKFEDMQSTEIKTITGYSGKITLGKLVQEDKCLIDFRYKKAQNGNVIARRDFIAKYICNAIDL